MIRKIKNKLKSSWQSSFLGKLRKDEDALRWGILGTGYMADTFSKSIIGSRQNILYAVASRSLDKAKKFVKSHAAKIPYGSYEEIVKDEHIDVIYIATPVECHYDNIKLCLINGKHVLCEKPLTLSIDQTEELFDLAKKRNLFLMEGMWTLTLPTIKKAKEWINTGLIGQIQFIRADLNKRLSNSHVQKHHGVLNDYGIYGIAFMQEFFGDNTAVKNAIRRGNNYPSDWCICYESDRKVGCLNIMSSLNAPSKAVIVGDKGSIEWNSPFNRTNKISLYNDEGNLIESFESQFSNEGFEYELDEVYNCLKTGMIESLDVPASNTINSIRTIQYLKNGVK